MGSLEVKCTVAATYFNRKDGSSTFLGWRYCGICAVYTPHKSGGQKMHIHTGIPRDMVFGTKLFVGGIGGPFSRVASSEVSP